MQTEVLAGISTFMALSYIFVVNPAILSQAGMDKSSVLFATIITSGIATLLMGIWARLPFVLAPGMEMNAYVAYYAVGALGLTWQQALGAVFWSGVLFTVLTVTRIRKQVVEAIPERMRASLSLSVGVFLALVALRIAGVVRYERVRIQGFGSLTSPAAIVLYISFAGVLVFDRLKIPGAVLIGLAAATLAAHWFGISDVSRQPVVISKSMFTAIGQFTPAVVLVPKSLSVILVLFLIDFYGSVAKLIGLSRNTSITTDGQVPRLGEALLIDSVGTTVGSALGTTSITVYVESGVGIAAGGRTGLSAVICGSLMLLMFVAAPFLNYVPLAATTGALLFVTVKLLPSLAELKQYESWDFAAAGAMQVGVIWSFALDRAVLIGFVIYAVKDLAKRKGLNPLLIGSACLLAIGIFLQTR